MYSPGAPPSAPSDLSGHATNSSARARQLVFPREHGAWGMLFVPLVTGAWIGVGNGGTVSGALWLAVAATALFCLRTPVESLLGTSPVRAANGDERHLAMRFIGLFGFVAAVALVRLTRHGARPGLLLLGAIVVVLVVAQMLVKRMGRNGRMPSQIIGALALTATAPAAYYASMGWFDERALGLWFANWAFAGNQIHFVQLRLRASKCRSWEEKFDRGRGFFVGQVVMMLALALAWAFSVVPPLVLLAFLPIFLRGMIWFFKPPQPLVLRHLGLTELAHAIVFGILLVIGLH